LIAGIRLEIRRPSLDLQDVNNSPAAEQTSDE